MHPGGGTSHHRVSAATPSPVLASAPPMQVASSSQPQARPRPSSAPEGGGGSHAPLPDVTPPGAAQGIMRQAKKNLKNRWSGCGDEEESGLLLAAGASEVPVDTPQLPPRSAAKDLQRVIHNTSLVSESKQLSSEEQLHSPVSLGTTAVQPRDRKETVC